MHSHQKQTNLQQAREVPVKVFKSKASSSAGLRCECHKRLPTASKKIRQHRVEHHNQSPPISIQYLLQAQTEGAQKRSYKMEICTLLQAA